MNINEIETRTGVSKQNVRFYEKKGLLNPNRNRENGYRVYTENDIYKINEIILFRKLGFTIEDILKIQKGHKSINESVIYYNEIAKLQMNHLKQQLVIYSDIQNDLQNGQSLDIEKYMIKIKDMESRGIQFFNVVSDYLKKAQDNMFKFIAPRHAFWFEPVEPILNKGDFLVELYKYADREGKELKMLHEGMEPIFELDHKKYIAMLELPHMISLPGPLWIFQGFFLMYRYTYGFKFAYLYEFDFNEQPE